MIACSIAGRSRAPEKVTFAGTLLGAYNLGVANPRALVHAGDKTSGDARSWSMDVGSVNILYLLAQCLRIYASGRKRGAMISGGQFVAHLAEHFGLLTE
ncbi:hypothetical protein Tco_1525536 [Tanacetum coccineum]